jgi:mRNA-degrading endonuclease RelE of RelBE toxin-antitoxin system
MLNIEHKKDFLKKVSKIRHAKLKERVKNLVLKIIENPEIGKPMRHNRKGTREVYLPPFRLAYSYIPKENKLIFIEIYHKYEQ